MAHSAVSPLGRGPAQSGLHGATGCVDPARAQNPGGVPLTLGSRAMTELRGARVLVTGASGGLGRAIARRRCGPRAPS